MFESAVNNGSQDFRLQKEVAETRAVDGDVGAFDAALGCAVGRDRGGLSLVLLLVVEQIVVSNIGHFWTSWF